MVAGADCRDGDLQHDEQEIRWSDGYGESSCPLGLSIRKLRWEREERINITQDNC